jgi:hypothetical protein
MLARRGRVFVSVDRRRVVDKRKGIHRLMEEALPREGHKVAVPEAVRESSRDLLSRHVEAADEYRWAEAAALDSHDAVCSPRGEDSMKVRGDWYSQDGMEVVELRRETWWDLTHFLDVRSLDPEGNLVSPDLGEDAEDMIEGVVDMATDGPCPEVGDGGPQNRCRAKGWDSMRILVVAYLRLEDSCTTLGSRLAAYDGCGLAVVGRRDGVVRV